MTKNQEIERLDQMIATTPEGYLKSLLAHLRPQFSVDIRSDFLTMPDLRELETDVLKARAQLAAVTNEVNRQRDVLKALDAQHREILARITDAKGEAAKIRRQLDYAVLSICPAH